MKHKLYVALIFGWFFSMQADYDGSAKISSIVGPFSSERACKAELEYVQDMTKAAGLEVAFKKCAFIKET